MLDELFGILALLLFLAPQPTPLVSFNIPVLKEKLEKLFLEVAS